MHQWNMKKHIEVFEHWIMAVLTVLMVIAITAATVELGVILVQELLRPPKYLLNVDEMLTVLSFFLIILIGLELLTTIKDYTDDQRINVEIVFLVSMIAIARKVIVLETKETGALTIMGISSIIIGLCLGYYLLRKSHSKCP